MIKWITNKDQLLKNKGIVKQFFTLYEHKDNFPDINEREEPSIIKKRIKENSTKPETNLLVYIESEESELVKGGAIIEYYPKSECCLITYIFINKADRNSGIARKIIRDNKNNGIPEFIKYLTSNGKRVKAVFFETNNPNLTDEAKDSMKPEERLKAFHKLGAKRIAFEYTQPSLDSNKEPVKNLYLCLFPELTGDELTIEIHVVLCFLVEFYYSLDALKCNFNNEFNEVIKWRPPYTPNFCTTEIQNMYMSLLEQTIKLETTYLIPLADLS